MKQTMIQLKATDEVQEFVKAASACDFDINLQCERAMVDAKSFLGVLSLGLCRRLTVTYVGMDGRFEQILNKYGVAQ
ncbi:MAG: HPr family phosphocarrier protein [Lachnospiraceae bacterium]|nr:HPr family phosphocarrier protein [Lachnospiraceae bacterium]